MSSPQNTTSNCLRTIIFRNKHGNVSNIMSLIVSRSKNMPFSGKIWGPPKIILKIFPKNISFEEFWPDVCDETPFLVEILVFKNYVYCSNKKKSLYRTNMQIQLEKIDQNVKTQFFMPTQWSNHFLHVTTVSQIGILFAWIQSGSKYL